MQKQNDIEILALGEPLMELCAEHEGGLDRVGRFKSGFGGDASNFAVAAARAGGSVGMVAGIGRDEFGDAFMSMWEREGVDTSLVSRDPQAPTGMYMITRRDGAHRFTYYRAGSAASKMSPGKLPTQAMEKARLVHVTGVAQGISSGSCDAALEAMELARRSGAVVTYDPNYRPSLWPLPRARAVIHESVAMADIVTPSMEEAEMMLGVSDPQEAVRRYLDMGAGIVALKLGADGAIVATQEDSWRIDPVRVRPVDCSGAGDTFAGAFAAAYLEDRPLEWCARFAVAAAGLSTTGLGCVGPIPRREAILKCMEQGGE